MKPFCIKGRRVSDFLIETEYTTYPMEDTKYLKTFPMWKDSYILIQRQKNNQYKLLKFLYCN